MQTLWQEFSVTYRFPVIFTRGIFSPGHSLLSETLLRAGGRVTILPVVDDGVAAADPALLEKIRRFFDHHSGRFTLAGPVYVLPGGERCKQGRGEAEKLRTVFARYGLCRHSVVIAIGGGAVLDVVGYAAATAHRGIRLLRIPTTTLAQNDAGIGVKNGYNSVGRKNYVGTFAPPFAVINDFEFLRTLPLRQARAGIAEAVKVALIKDASFFNFLYSERRRLARLAPEAMEPMIVRCACLHLQHIAHGDPFEHGSARPLDAGHWSAHALEEMTVGAILHGEAVAIGLALDVFYAEERGLLDRGARDRILRLLRDVGFTLAHPALAQLDLQEALNRFREHLGGPLTITLPCGIGEKTEVAEVDLALLHRSREALLKDVESRAGADDPQR